MKALLAIVVLVLVSIAAVASCGNGGSQNPSNGCNGDPTGSGNGAVTVTNTNTNSNVNSATSTASSTSTSSAVAKGGNAYASGGQSTSYADLNVSTPHQAPDAIAPPSYPTAPCRVAGSAGASWLTGGLGLGLSKNDGECELRETARSFMAAGDRKSAIVLLCATKAAKRAKLDACKPAPVPTTFTRPLENAEPLAAPVPITLLEPAPAPITSTEPVPAPIVTVGSNLEPKVQRSIPAKPKKKAKLVIYEK